MAEKKAAPTDAARRLERLEQRMLLEGIREPRLERRGAEEASAEAQRLLDRYGHQHDLVGAVKPSDELVGLCAIGANAQASARARLEVAMHRRKHGES